MLDTTPDGPQRQITLGGFIGRWGLNWEDGSRLSLLRDLEHIEFLVGLVNDPAIQAVCTDLKSSCGSLRRLIRDDSTYYSDGRMMKLDQSKEVARLVPILTDRQRIISEHLARA